jgi:antirestriction protein
MMTNSILTCEDNTPRVWIGIWADYNAGYLTGEWVTVPDTREELQQEINKIMLTSKEPNVIATVCNECGHVSLNNYDDCFECGSEDVKHQPSADEWGFFDHENIPSSMISESAIDEEFFELLEMLESSHLDREVIEAGLDLDIPLDSIEDAYQGEYSNDQDFAYELAESCGSIDHDAVWPQNCIDWEQAAATLMYDYNESNGHYFSANW